MQCKTVIKYIPFYYYNDLDKKTILGIKSHIKDCRVCRTEFEFWKKSLNLVGKEEKINLPFTYRRTLLNRILKATNLKEEREILQRKRVLVFSSSFVTVLTLLFSILTSIRINNNNIVMNWQNDSFTYSIEELNQKMINLDEIALGNNVQTLNYGLSEKIDSILGEIKELMIFSEMKGGEEI